MGDTHRFHPIKAYLQTLHELRLINNFIWEAGELGHVVRKADREALKRFITTELVTVRPHYAIDDIKKPAIASFIGTINDEGTGFLNDPTGNRRYVVTTITQIDWSYTKMDVNDIWGQAFELYLQGEPWMLTIDEARRRDEINAAYQQEEPFETMIAAKFEIDSSKADEPEWAMTTPDILWYLDVDSTRRDFTMRTSAALKGEGLEKDKNKQAGKNRTGEQIRARFWRGIRVRPT